MSGRLQRHGVLMRAWLDRHTPRVVHEFPYEVFLVGSALITSLPLLIGITSSVSLVTLLPPMIVIAWGVSLLLGGLTVAAGLVLRHAPTLASGLSLLGIALGVYAGALIAVAGFAAAGVAAPLYVFDGALALLRALHFRRITDIRDAVRRSLREPTS